jgi:hypothetical protein
MISFPMHIPNWTKAVICLGLGWLCAFAIDMYAVHRRRSLDVFDSEWPGDESRIISDPWLSWKGYNYDLTDPINKPLNTAEKTKYSIDLKGFHKGVLLNQLSSMYDIHDWAKSHGILNKTDDDWFRNTVETLLDITMTLIWYDRFEFKDLAQSHTAVCQRSPQCYPYDDPKFDPYPINEFMDLTEEDWTQNNGACPTRYLLRYCAIGLITGGVPKLDLTHWKGQYPEDIGVVEVPPGSVRDLSLSI